MTAAVWRSVSGSQRRNQRSLVTVKAGRGTLPQAAAQPARPAGELGQELFGVLRRLGVVPQLGRAENLALVVEDDETVLLRAHGEGDGAKDAAHPRRGAGQMKGLLPVPRMLLAAWWCRRRVWGPGRRHDRAGLRVAYLHLAGRGGRVHPDHQRH